MNFYYFGSQSKFHSLEKTDVPTALPNCCERFWDIEATGFGTMR